MLKEDGLSPAEVGRLRTPIGLAIGAKSAAEIALAIAAQIVAVREGKEVVIEQALPNAAATPSARPAELREPAAG